MTKFQTENPSRPRPPGPFRKLNRKYEGILIHFIAQETFHKYTSSTKEHEQHDQQDLS